MTLLGARQQFAGNDGYEDVLGEYYCCDSTVPNARHLSISDVLVLRDNQNVLGTGRIQLITSWAADKPVRRCPECNWGKIKQRATVEPTYRCQRCKAPFAAPSVELKRVVEFRVFYGDTWQPCVAPLLVRQLAPYYRSRAAQNAIRELHPTAALAALGVVVPDTAEITEIPGGFADANVRARINQGPFRSALMRRFDSKCAITGPCHPVALEAAHMYRYAETGRHLIDGGLLLRRDLHALFDKHLLAIDPGDWTVRVAPTLACYPDIQQFDGQAVQIPERVRPRASFVEEHFRKALQLWAKDD